MAALEFLSLPAEILDDIFIKCDIATLGRLSITCKYVRECIDGGAVWRVKWEHVTRQGPITVKRRDMKTPNYKSMIRRYLIIQPHASTNINTSGELERLLDAYSKGTKSAPDVLSLDFGSKTSWLKRSQGNWSCTENTRTPIRPWHTELGRLPSGWTERKAADTNSPALNIPSIPSDFLEPHVAPPPACRETRVCDCQLMRAYPGLGEPDGGKSLTSRLNISSLASSPNSTSSTLARQGGLTRMEAVCHTSPPNSGQHTPRGTDFTTDNEGISPCGELDKADTGSLSGSLPATPSPYAVHSLPNSASCKQSYTTFSTHPPADQPHCDHISTSMSHTLNPRDSNHATSTSHNPVSRDSNHATSMSHTLNPRDSNHATSTSHNPVSRDSNHATSMSHTLNPRDSNLDLETSMSHTLNPRDSNPDLETSMSHTPNPRDSKHDLETSMSHTLNPRDSKHDLETSMSHTLNPRDSKHDLETSMSHTLNPRDSKHDLETSMSHTLNPRDSKHDLETPKHKDGVLDQQNIPPADSCSIRTLPCEGSDEEEEENIEEEDGAVRRVGACDEEEDGAVRRVGAVDQDFPDCDNNPSELLWVSDEFLPQGPLLCTCIMCFPRIRLLAKRDLALLPLADPASCVHLHTRAREPVCDVGRGGERRRAEAVVECVAQDIVESCDRRGRVEGKGGKGFSGGREEGRSISLDKRTDEAVGRVGAFQTLYKDDPREHSTCSDYLSTPDNVFPLSSPSTHTSAPPLPACSECQTCQGTAAAGGVAEGAMAEGAMAEGGEKDENYFVYEERCDERRRRHSRQGYDFLGTEIVDVRAGGGPLDAGTVDVRTGGEPLDAGTEIVDVRAGGRPLDADFTKQQDGAGGGSGGARVIPAHLACDCQPSRPCHTDNPDTPHAASASQPADHNQVLPPSVKTKKDLVLPEMSDISDVVKRLVNLSGARVCYYRTICQVNEPKGWKRDQLAQLVKVMFETLGVQSLCLVPKAVSVSMALGVDTCLVVDSGAHFTLVAAVVGQRLLAGTECVRAVGGAHISQTLAEVLHHKGINSYVCACEVDGRDVKSHCYLKHHPRAARQSAPKPHQLSIRSLRHSSGWCSVSLTEELYLAPEVMYSTLNLPAMIHQSITGLPPHLQKRLLSNVILTGGNCSLTGLNARLQVDLQRRMLQFAPWIWVRSRNVNLNTGNDGVEGLSYIGLPGVGGHSDHLYIGREEYISQGALPCLYKLQAPWRVSVEEVEATTTQL